MKNLKYIYILMVGLMLQACSDFLELEPEAGISPDNFYKTERDADLALTGIYDILGYQETYGSYLWYEFGLGTDVSLINRSNQSSGVYVNNYNPGQVELGRAWEALYDGINRANLFIDRAPGIDMDSTKRERVIGEARFLRGLLYFNLVRLWGEVPLKTTPTTSVFDTQIEKSSISDIYAVVLEDMEFAEKVVPAASAMTPAENGRVCQGAVQGLLARVCLTMAGEPLKDASKYAEALAWAQKVVDSGEHGLLDDYQTVFTNLVTDVFDTKESMFEIVFYGAREGDGEAWRFGGINSIDSRDKSYGFSYAFFNATQRLYNLYEPSDTRRDISIATYRVLADGTQQPYTATDLFNRKPGKWDRSASSLKNQNFTPTNYPVIRYADVLLMLAEAENEVNGPTTKALDALNAVRTRDETLSLNNTGATVLTSTDLPDQTTFRQAIMDERARELCHEGERKMDLIRWGTYISTMKSISAEIVADYPGNLQFMTATGDNVEEKHLLLPIPSNELELNSALEQNPMW